MLSDTNVKWITWVDKHTPRKWCVTEIRYDNDYDGYCVHELGENEKCVFGTPFAAYKHAKELSNKYKKKWSDAVVIINEVSVD